MCVWKLVTCHLSKVWLLMSCGSIKSNIHISFCPRLGRFNLGISMRRRHFSMMLFQRWRFPIASVKLLNWIYGSKRKPTNRSKIIWIGIKVMDCFRRPNLMKIIIRDQSHGLLIKIWLKEIFLSKSSPSLTKVNVMISFIIPRCMTIKCTQMFHWLSKSNSIIYQKRNRNC